MNQEIWKPIDGFNGLYEISNMGRCRSFVRRKEGRLMKGTRNTLGYIYYPLGGKLYRACRLVAKAFIPNPGNRPFVDHINTIRSDDRVENLRWTTPKENMNNPKTINNFEVAFGDLHVAQYDKNGKFLRIFNRVNDVIKEFPHLDSHNIRHCCRGEYKTCGGYIWRFV